jgi:hypothetical protein
MVGYPILSFGFSGVQSGRPADRKSLRRIGWFDIGMQLAKQSVDRSSTKDPTLRDVLPGRNDPILRCVPDMDKETTGYVAEGEIQEVEKTLG